MENPNDCPICYGENLLEGRDAICPNGHKFCETCQPHIQSVRTGWGMGQYGRTNTACCPLCRATIPYVPLGIPFHEEMLARQQAQAQQEPVVLGPGYMAWRAQQDQQAQQARAERARAQQDQQRRFDEARAQRAVDGWHNNIENRARERTEFLRLRAIGAIPGDAIFGGVHNRKCGNRNCDRRTGAGGVRFLKIGAGRVYRCEVCFRNA